MNLSAKLEVANVSDTGKKRPHNEDSAVSDTSLGFAVVADGMGGYKAGEVASAIAAQAVLERLRQGVGVLTPGQRDADTGLMAPALLLRRAIEEANLHVFRTANEVQQCQGMGTTIAALLFYDNTAIIAHVGDSRVYRMRDGVLAQVTQDHSLVQELIDRGFFTAEEAEANTPKNLVTRALGIEDSVDVDVHEDPTRPGDIYLLCSDGLNDMVDDEEIRLTLSKYSANLVEAANDLIRQANESGGRDNISVILARPLAAFPAQSGVSRRIKGMFPGGRERRTSKNGDSGKRSAGKKA